MKTIHKAKITKENKLEVEYQNNYILLDGDPCQDEVKLIGGAPVHADLVTAFNKLNIHLIAICELAEFEDLQEQPDLLSPYQLTGFTIGGDDDQEGVCLIGRKNLSTKKVLNLVAPFTKYQDETADYDHAYELKMAVMKACEEVVAYIEGKHQPSTQMKLGLN